MTISLLTSREFRDERASDLPRVQGVRRWMAGEVPAHCEVRRLHNDFYPDSDLAVTKLAAPLRPQPLRAPKAIWADIRALERGRRGCWIGQLVLD